MWRNARRFLAIGWCLVATVLVGAGLLVGAVLLALTLVLRSPDVAHTRSADDIAGVAASLGRFESLPGTTLLRAPLHATRSYAIGYEYEDAYTARNYLFLDPDTRTSRWLQPSMDGLIVRTWEVPESRATEDGGGWTFAVYAIVVADTNGDGALTAADQFRIAGSKPDGTGYRLLAERADRVNDARLLAADRMIVLYTADGKLHAVEFNPEDSAAPPQTHEVALPAPAE
jgi:hypothetical protein